MLAVVRRWRDELGDSTALGVARVVLGILFLDGALRAWGELDGGYFGDSFHWPIIPESLVPSRGGYEALVVAQGLLAAIVITGHRGRARLALFASALLGAYVLCCDRLRFHNNRWALCCYALLLSLAPCDRSFSVSRRPARPLPEPLWAARLAKLQLSLIYLASGGSKLFDPDWRSGKVLLGRFALYGGHAIDSGVPAPIVAWLSRPGTACVLAGMAIATECGLAVGLWSRRARVAVLWWGVWFHLTIEATSRVEGFTWLTLAVYALFATPDVRARRFQYDPSSARGRLLARVLPVVDWLARFEVGPLTEAGAGQVFVITRRDGTRATGIDAAVALASCTPPLFPFWAPLALFAEARRYLCHSPR